MVRVGAKFEIEVGTGSPLIGFYVSPQGEGKAKLVIEHTDKVFLPCNFYLEQMKEVTLSPADAFGVQAAIRVSREV